MTSSSFLCRLGKKNLKSKVDFCIEILLPLPPQIYVFKGLKWVLGNKKYILNDSNMYVFEGNNPANRSIRKKLNSCQYSQKYVRSLPQLVGWWWHLWRREWATLGKNLSFISLKFCLSPRPSTHPCPVKPIRITMHSLCHQRGTQHKKWDSLN